MKITKQLIIVKPITAVCLSLVITFLIPISSLRAENRQDYTAKITYTGLFKDTNLLPIELVLEAVVSANKENLDIDNLKAAIAGMKIRGLRSGIGIDDCTSDKVSIHKAKARFRFTCTLPENARQLLIPGLSTLNVKLVELSLTGEPINPIPVTVRGANFLQVTGGL